jgi:Na+/H+-dicarboxylate symporter
MKLTLKNNLTLQIISAMMLGLIVGVIIKMIPQTDWLHKDAIEVFSVLGKIFIMILKMLIVPIVFVSLVYGTCQLRESTGMGKMIFKTLAWYIFTTALAITLAIFISVLFNVGGSANFATPAKFIINSAPSLKAVILDMFPENPIASLANGKMLQIIIFAILFGIAMSASGESGKKLAGYFKEANDVLITLIHLIMKVAPYGVFCLLTVVFAGKGISLIGQLIGYFMTVILVLLIQAILIYGGLLRIIARLSPIRFYKKMVSAMLFAFSTSSSNASIPVVLDTVKNKLGVSNGIASFVVPLGATINMDGTAIMQGVATVFISHLYNIPIGITGYLTVILMATLASIGTAGVPSVGLITLAMVLEQVGLPVEGIALIIGIDRLLDMLRTAVNIAGDSTVACLVAKSEKQHSEKIFNQ